MLYSGYLTVFNLQYNFLKILCKESVMLCPHHMCNTMLFLAVDETRAPWLQDIVRKYKEVNFWNYMQHLFLFWLGVIFRKTYWTCTKTYRFYIMVLTSQCRTQQIDSRPIAEQRGVGIDVMGRKFYNLQ